MKKVEINNTKIFYLLPKNQLLEEGLRQYKLFFTFQHRWDSYAKEAINLLFKSAVENLTCAILLGEEAATLPLAELYYSGTPYKVSPDLVFGDYIILLGQKLEYEPCKNISLRIITNTNYFEKHLEKLAITVTFNSLFYYSNFRCIGENIKKKSLEIAISNLIMSGIFVNLNILV
ncbi:MAG: hypothetical protein RCO49_06110 [Rickettsia endosymbiont of Argas persicus]